MDTNKDYNHDVLCFDEISDMSYLKKRVEDDEVYKEKFFVVNIVHCEKKYIGSYKDTKRETLSFGNKTDNEFRTNYVCIQIYDDYVELVDNQTGKIFEKNISTKNLSNEDKIFSALNIWNNYYRD